MSCCENGVLRQIAVLLAALLLSGCAAVGPNYQKPDIQTPDTWSEKIAGEMEQGQQAVLQSWWTVFRDPVLDDLIERARLANLDLKIAVARIGAARAILASNQGSKQPVVIAAAGASIEHPSDSESAPGAENNIESFDLGAGASWEIDVFGRVRRSIESAGASYEASVEDYRDVMVSLYADVARAYIDLRGQQQRIRFAKSNAASMAESLKLAEDRYESGVSSRLDVVQARANLMATKAAIPLLQISLSEATNRLAVLLGQNAGSLQYEFEVIQPLPSTGGLVGMGVPADVLRQRPDIRHAERLLAAQTAQVGVATADLYPSFSLGGFFGLQSGSLSSLFKSSALSWGLQSPVQWNIFNGGVVRSNIDFQNALLQQRLLQYQQQVLKAVEEVENALSSFNHNQVRHELLENASAATAEAVDLVLVQYNTGLTNFSNVLVTQRDLVSLQDQLIVTQANTETALVALYEALGGGWSQDDVIQLTGDTGLFRITTGKQ